jgi:hypothetical protein
MKRSPRFLPRLAALAFLVGAAVPAAAHGAFDFDNQLWMTLLLDARLAPRLSLYFKNELRLGNDVSEAAHFHAEAGLKIKAHDLLWAGLFYRQSFEHERNYYDEQGDLKKAWDTEFKPGWFFSLNLRPGRVVFSEVLRFEIPVQENGRGEKFRLKHITMLGVRVPKDSAKSVLPYIKNTQLFTLHPDTEYYYNRTAVGLIFPAGKFVDLDLYYMWERKMWQTSFYDFFILGLGATFKIGQEEKGPH